MGKKRVAQKGGGQMDAGLKSRALKRAPKKKVAAGTLYIRATFNNTLLTLTDKEGNTVAWSTAGALGFRGAKRGTPFAAAKTGELIAEKAAATGMKEASIIIKGVGAGRESAMRSFANKHNITISRIADYTPIPHGGVRPPKPRRV